MTAHDLFGPVPAGKARDTTPCDLLLSEAPGASTDKAWALRQGRGGAVKHVPRSLASRPDPARPDLYRMPKWKAKELGWL